MKTKCKRSGIIVLAAIIGFSMNTLSLTGCGDNGGSSGPPGVVTVAVTGVSLDQDSLTFSFINHGADAKTETLSATVSPADATNRNVSWASDTTAVATVDANGKVTAVAAGTAKITVTTEDGSETAQCNVTVTESLIDMVRIQAGTFTMGSPESEPGRYDRESPQHQVTLTAGFYMGTYLVTQAQYEEVIGTNPSHFTTPADGDNPDNRPVEQVRWYDAVVFCNKLSILEGLTPVYSIDGKTDPDEWGAVPTGSDATWNAVEIVAGSTGYRLPTEAQWEYACRAGTTSAFNWGTDIIDDTQANYYASYVDDNNLTAGTYFGRTSEVGSYAPNAWGLYDMHGNVFEWCWDRYEDYSGDAQTDPSGAVTGADRVGRGGSWGDIGQYARSASRYYSSPAYRYDFIGFRLLRP